MTDGPEKKHVDVRVQLAANCPTAFLISQDISSMAIFSEFNICTFLLRASNVDVLDHLEIGEISGVRDVDFALNCGCVFLSFLKFGQVDDASFLRTSFQSLFCVCFPDFDLAEPFRRSSSQYVRRMFWWRMCSPSCAAGCIFSNVVPVWVFAVLSFISSDQAIHFQGFSHQYARTS